MTSFNIDSSHSQLTFKVRHLGFSNVRGRFETFAGQISFDPERPESLQAKATVDVKSVNTGVDQRDEHLRSADFFNSEEHSEMRFEATAVSGTLRSLNVVGDLTIAGTTREVALDVTFMGRARDPWVGSGLPSNSPRGSTAPTSA